MKTFQTLIFFASLSMVQLYAANIDWDGGGADSQWGTDANWVGDVKPSGSDTAILDGSAGAITVSGAEAVGQVRLSANGSSLSGTGSFTLLGGTFADQDLFLNNSNMSVDLVLGVNGLSIYTPDNRKPIVSGNISDGGNGYQLSIISENDQNNDLTVISGNNTYSGGTIFEGPVQAGSNNAFGSGDLTWNRRTANANTNQLVLSGGVDLSNNILLDNAANTVYRLRRRGGSAPSTLSRDLTGGDSSSTIRVEPGNSRTMVFSGDSTVSTSIEIRNGTVLFDGSLTGPGGDIKVFNNATLGGSGEIGRTINIATGGTLSPGNSIGSMGANNFEFESGSTFLFEIDTDNTTADLLYVTSSSEGGLRIDNADLNLQDLGLGGDVPVVGTKFTLISYSSTGPGWDGGVFNGFLNGGVFNFAGTDWIINYADTSAGSNFTSQAESFGNFFVTIQAIPEPSTLGFVLLTGLTGFVWLRRRQNK